MSSFFSLIVVSTLSFFVFTLYLDVTCVVSFCFATLIVIFVFSPYSVVTSMDIHVSCLFLHYNCSCIIMIILVS
jgi:hypothetical protein